jgi:hypothetical protein
VSPARPRGDAGGSLPPERPAPATSPGAGAGLERVVALALGAMVAVLALIYVEMVRAPGPRPPADFDWQNPMLLAQPGQCVEISDSSSPGDASWLAVRAPGVVLRPFEGPKSIAGWSHPSLTDPRTFPPYLLGESRRAAEADRPPGLPPEKETPYLFPLNGFGMPIEAAVVLRDIGIVEDVKWGGRSRRGYAVGLYRYDSQFNGPWVIYSSKDAPVLGTMMREYAPKIGQRNRQSFRVPENCR